MIDWLIDLFQLTLASADARYYGQNPDPRQKLWGFDWKWLPLLRALAITELRTLSWYQSDNFIVWLLIKRTLCTSHVTLLCKITVYCSSFAKIHFKRFQECLLSHRFLKLSAQSSSLLHLSLCVFLPGSLGELKPSCSILNGCWTLSVLLISSSSLGRYFGSPCI